MTISRRFVCTALLGVAATIACGGEDTGVGNTIPESLTVFTGDAEFSAASAQATLVGSLLTVHAEGATGGVTRVLTITATTTTPGSFTIGLASGATVRYSELTAGATSAKEWLASSAGAAGTLTITELSTTRVGGSFAATLPPIIATGASAPKVLSGGTFTLKILRD